MRIRKCAARLLGTVSASFSSSPSPLPRPPSQQSLESNVAFSPDAAAILCELNRSPWDDLMFLDLIPAFDQEEEEEEDGEGITGNAVKAEAGEDRGITGNPFKNEAEATASVEREEARKKTGKMRNIKRKKKKNKKTKKKENVIAVVKEEEEEEERTGGSCKKSDGRGWRCKRPAEHPHSLCSYHLAQLRSYNASKVAAEASREGHAGTGRKKKTDVSDAAATDDSDFYYYYSGFGPWRGKTRSGFRSSDISGARGFALDKNEHNSEDGEDNRIVYDVSAVTIAGEDEEEDSGDGVDNAEGGGGGADEGGSASRNTNNRGNYYKSYRKRGRKRMKARSLKSLL
ncbi:uncharacterized protein LOC141830060 [Curcuma longa]|uniref:uncharacterized protein LOC141830060 n=1 Tax=Curcuma longa TaxID=136217 RepID=UPI003D9F8F5D